MMENKDEQGELVQRTMNHLYNFSDAQARVYSQHSKLEFLQGDG